MPNSRKKGKVILGAWVDENLAAEVKQIATDNGWPMSKAIEMIVKEGMENYGKGLSVNDGGAQGKAGHSKAGQTGKSKRVEPR